MGISKNIQGIGGAVFIFFNTTEIQEKHSSCNGIPPYQFRAKCYTFFSTFVFQSQFLRHHAREDEINGEFGLLKLNARMQGAWML